VDAIFEDGAGVVWVGTPAGLSRFSGDRFATLSGSRLPERTVSAIVAAAPDHVALVRKLFFEPLPDELVSPFTAALEHIQASLNLNSSLPPVPL
jgi:hypothetical protein